MHPVARKLPAPTGAVPVPSDIRMHPMKRTAIVQLGMLAALAPAALSAQLAANIESTAATRSAAADTVYTDSASAPAGRQTARSLAPYADYSGDAGIIVGG